MDRIDEFRLTKQIIKKEVKKSNQLVRKIKLGYTIFDEPDFRNSLKMSTKTIFDEDRFKENLAHYDELTVASQTMTKTLMP